MARTFSGVQTNLCETPDLSQSFVGTLPVLSACNLLNATTMRPVRAVVVRVRWKNRRTGSAGDAELAERRATCVGLTQSLLQQLLDARVEVELQLGVDVCDRVGSPEPEIAAPPGRRARDVMHACGPACDWTR